MTANNCINSPGLGNILLTASGLLATDGSGQGEIVATIPFGLTFSAANLFSSENYFTSVCCFENNSATYNVTATIRGIDLSNKIILSTPASAINLTIPTATDFNTELGSPPPLTALEGITITNLSATFSITLLANTGFSLSGVPNTIILPLTTRFFKAQKNTTSPSFILYG